MSKFIEVGVIKIKGGVSPKYPNYRITFIFKDKEGTEYTRTYNRPKYSDHKKSKINEVLRIANISNFYFDNLSDEEAIDQLSNELLGKKCFIEVCKSNNPFHQINILSIRA